MINRQTLLSDLQRLLPRLEADLLERSESTDVPEVGRTLRAEFERAQNAKRTAQNYEDWRTDAITQAAAAWVLSCVFVRFLEDNRLIDPPRLSGPASGATHTPLPDGRGSIGSRLARARDEHELYFRAHPTQTDREYLLSILDELARLPGTRDVFGQHNPIRELPNWLSGDAAGELLRFFQKIDANTGALIHDFMDANWDTRFLGDLYQDLSEAARKKYALLQTPDFVEQFILDRTLDPALDEFGLELAPPATSRAATVRERSTPDEPNAGLAADSASSRARLEPDASTQPQYFRMIDPACGSGHFLLGAFPRILRRWQRQEPDTNIRVLVQRTLDSIHGVDVNPFAIAIARFRLLLAALRACGIQRLADTPAFRLNLVCGDSLLHVPLKSGRKKFTKGQLEFDSMVTDTDSGGDVNHAYQSEDLQELKRIVRPGQYHAVVANPPYITPKDRALNEQYRNRFESCHMKYSLAAPFMEQLFRLAIRPNPSQTPIAPRALESEAPNIAPRLSGSEAPDNAPRPSGSEAPDIEPRPSGSEAPDFEPRPSGSGSFSNGAEGRGPLPDGRGSRVDGSRIGGSRITGAGYVGQITANSFMKREFGKKLIESFFPTVDLTHVIDTSGAYIPGHGTPTVILFGRNRPPVASTLRTVMGIRGEPSTPADPAQGLVWTAITTLIDQPDSRSDSMSRAATVRERSDSRATGEETASLRARLEEHGQFVSVSDSQRDLFHKHPWSIGGGGASELKEVLEEGAAARLEHCSHVIGITAVTGEDELYMQPQNVLRRRRVEFTRRLVVGDVARDWEIAPGESSIWLYDERFALIKLDELPHTSHLMWAYRAAISQRRRFGTPMIQRGLAWYEWQELYADKLRTPLSIVFAEVATHNHFVLDRGGKVFKNSAPVIKLPAMIEEPRPSGSGIVETPLPDGRGSKRPVTEDDHLALVGLLNSSTACFWMKQVCHNKGSTVDQHGARQRTAPFEDFFAFNGTKLQQFPLPAGRPLHTAQILDNMSTRLLELQPGSLVSRGTPTREVLAAARSAADRLLSQMIAVQEELDWECYRLYGLIGADLTCAHAPSSRARQEADHPTTASGDDRFLTGAARGLRLGQRAFEIVLARKMVAGETQSTWFERHGSTPITELPSDWPDDYRQLVERRIALIESDPSIRLIEQPEYKRRWNTEPWESQLERALRDWLLNRLESYFDFDGRMAANSPPRPISPPPPISSRARQEADAPTAAPDDDRSLTVAARDSGDRSLTVAARGDVSAAEVEPQAFFVTFTCYGTWLHGDERGSVDRDHNEWQTPPLDPDEDRERREFQLLRHSPVRLESQQRSIVQQAIQEVCEHRGWRLHAINVRTNHVHVVVTANRVGKRVLNDFKSYATRRMTEAACLPAACLEVHSNPASSPPHSPTNSSRARQEADHPAGGSDDDRSLTVAARDLALRARRFRVWTRGGSARPIQTEHSLRRAIEYTLHEQGPDITPHGDEGRAQGLGGGPLPDGRGSSDAGGAAVGTTAPLADIALCSIARLATVAAQDADFLQVGELYRNDPAFDVQALVTELVAPECVPLLPVLRYKPAGLIKRTTWERTWDLQRQEDIIDARTQLPATDPDYLTEDAAKALKAKQVGKIPVPTKYDSKDFLTSDFWRLRGKLDVPKERWISFPHCDGPDGTLMLCWAGYDHLQQARAISAYYVQVQTEIGGTDDPRLIPLLACLIELLPWLKQWHNDLDPEFNMSMGDYFEGFINEEARQLGKTLQEIREWTPPAKSTVRKSRKAKS
jgi:REP element-mobilizing transposase RayT